MAWISIGGVLLAAALALLAFGDAFAYEVPLVETPVVWLVLSASVAGGGVLALPRLVRRSPPSGPLIAGMIALGLVLRLLMLPSTPALEDDFYRYLWDGAVAAAKLSPYAHAPAAVLAGSVEGDDGAALARLAAASGEVLGRVNHPRLRTIYPPVTQAAFALAHGLAPWSLMAWRAVLLVFDLAALALLFMLLAALGRSPLWAALYWWNPLVVKELFNSAHVEGLLVFLLLGTALLAIRGRTVWAAAVLALAAGVKLWPVLLLPVVLHTADCGARKALAAVILFGALVAVMAWPVVAAGLGPDSGVTAYARTWEMNDALFMALAWALDGVLRAAGLMDLPSDMPARLLVGGFLVAFVVWLCRRPAWDAEALCGRFLAVIAALFLLGPTQFPWYYVPLVPFLAALPRYSLLLLSATLPLYYLRFHFAARGAADVFDHGVVWLEYLPVWLLLAGELAAARGRNGRHAR